MGTMPAFILECKDYPGSIGYGDDDGVLHGRLKFIRDLVFHEGDDAKHLKAAFQEAVDGYPAHREADDRKPDMPRKSSFNVRPGRVLYRRAMCCARRLGSASHRRQRCAAARARTRRHTALNKRFPTRLGDQRD